MPKIVFLAGLPRSGSTLLCNLLAQHPELGATPSSPLCHIVQNMRRQWSDDPFLLAQLDDNFEEVYARLERSWRAFMLAWCAGDARMVVDKNRGWLWCLETLRSVFPDFKMIVTLRDLRSVYTSIEKQHRKTLLLEFPDHLEHNLVDVRAKGLFDDGGLIGSVVRALNNVGDVPNISRHLYYVRYEDLLHSPQQALGSLTGWLGLEPHEFKLDDIEQVTVESDSHYRFKFPHKVQRKLEPPASAAEVQISPRILNEIRTRFAWYYDTYYPEGAAAERNGNGQAPPAAVAGLTEIESQVSQEIDEALA
jgi:sulfotransferase